MLALDDIDRSLIHALHVDGRAPFTKIATVLGTSTQTVVRRYARLRAGAGLRVVALPDPPSARRQQWIVRLTAAAARHPSNVAHHRGLGALPAAHLPGRPHRLARSPHRIHRGPTTSATTTGSRRRSDYPHRPDHQLLAALAHDGRASYTDLAAITGWSAPTVTRRIDELRRRGALFFDVELDDALLGITTSALLWMSVAPAHLDHVATTLARHAELAFVAATTGPTNLLAMALCPDPEALHHYLINRLAFDTITSIETAPILRTLKATAPIRPT